MLFFLLEECREVIPGASESLAFHVGKLPSGSKMAPVTRLALSKLFLWCFLLAPHQRNEDFMQLPRPFIETITCLDTHPCHLVAVSMDAGYKRRKFPFWHQLSPNG